MPNLEPQKAIPKGCIKPEGIKNKIHLNLEIRASTNQWNNIRISERLFQIGDGNGLENVKREL